jgi:hypothetical protein
MVKPYANANANAIADADAIAHRAHFVAVSSLGDRKGRPYAHRAINH